MRGCWSCGSHSACEEECICAKCINPEGYDNWRSEYPEQYEAWLETQQLESDDQCNCPGCRYE